MTDPVAAESLNAPSGLLMKHHGKKAIILLDEYDTPMQEAYTNYNDFIRALLLGDIKAMNIYMNRVTLEMFSYFDTSRNPHGEPERFYHGFVLGLMAELTDTVSRTLQ